MFTVESARAELARLLPLLDEVVALRADAAELSVALRSGADSLLGGMAEFKAAQARIDELLSEVAAAGVQVKGVAPLLLDFPGEQGGTAVLYCWLEGDRRLDWYHRTDLGFAGRRRL